MRKSVLTVSVLSVFFLFYCGGGSSGDNHPLKGTWEGHVAPLGALTFTIDGSGNVTQILHNGVPWNAFEGGKMDDGPDTFTMTLDHITLGPLDFPFLPDAQQVHAALAMMVGVESFIAAMEKDGSPSTNFFQSDVVGSWSGYGYAYSQTALGFMPFSPVTVDAANGSPITFSVTMPVGTITGVLPDFANLTALWTGNAAVSGAAVFVVMSPDKQFTAVETLPVNYSNLEDLTLFALNREP